MCPDVFILDPFLGEASLAHVMFLAETRHLEDSRR